MTTWNRWLIVIPARLNATRLPEKPLQDLGGKALIARVYERLAPLEQEGATIIVATDSIKVISYCQSQNIPATMTSQHHQSGTDRVHEVAINEDKPFILNVQGDEPFIDLADLRRLTEAMEASQQPMGTLVFRNKSLNDFNNPNVVKAVVDQQGKALYFSRAPIPYCRDDTFKEFWHHQGVYGFSKEGLDKFCKLESHPLENTEKLEQLRALGHGMDIIVTEAMSPAFGIDTPQDLDDARKKF